MEGWIKLHRKFLEWEWYQDSKTVHLFIYFLLKANYENKKWEGIEIKRGQLVTGLNSIKKDIKISVQSIRTCINKLKSTGELTIKSTNKYSIVTICNYEQYQDIEYETNKQSNNQSNKRLTNNQQTTNNKQECKERKECIDQECKERKEKKEYKERKEKKFIPPTLQEFKDYFKENNYKIDIAERAWRSYDVANWHDSYGKQIKNWKQKAIQVWFKPENKEKKYRDLTNYEYE